VRRAGGGRAGRARAYPRRPRLDPRRRRPVRGAGAAGQGRLRPLCGDRHPARRHHDRTQPGPAAGCLRPHRRAGDRLRRGVHTRRPAGARHAGAGRRGGCDHRQGALRRRVHGRAGPGGTAGAAGRRVAAAARPPRRRTAVDRRRRGRERRGGSTRRGRASTCGQRLPARLVAVTVAVRVIPCLDVDAGRVVKGVNFLNLRDAGDPVELAAAYDAAGADELTFLDVTASADQRETMYDVVRRTAESVFIPLTVGGGVRSVKDVDALLRADADKVGVNTAAIARPEVITEIAERFGRQVLVLSLDVRRAPGTPSGFEVTTHGGRRGTGIDAVEWARRGAELGAGEILLNSMDADGTKA